MATSSKRISVLDPDFEKIVTQWYEDIETDNSDTETDANVYQESEHETASEQEHSDSDDDLECIPDNHNVIESEDEITDTDDNTITKKKQNNFYGKNRYKWSKKEPTRNVRVPAHNIIRLPVARVDVDDETNPLLFFNKLFCNEMCDLIIRWTNKKLSAMRKKFKRQNKPELSDITTTELQAFLGLLLFTAIFKSNNEDIRSIFATDGTGRDIFRSVMSQERFATLLIALRFDNPEDREDRKKENSVAAINEFFDMFVRNCQNSYVVGATTCVDEMLVGFRGRCSFKMYIPSKPEKYGIKVMSLTDARTHYFYNAYIYAGKDSDGRGLTVDEKKMNKPTQSVIRLAKSLFQSNRNITADNWFSSIELAEYLLKNKITFVGTLKKNKRELPPEFLPTKGRKIGETIYGFTKNITILSHTPKKNKVVIAMSTMHHTEATDLETGKPEIIAFYNLTKGGVDAIDEKCAKYSCSRRTRRWPMAIFYKVLDICSVNAFIIYSSIPGNNLSRFNFVKKLANQMVDNHLRGRLEQTYMTREIKCLIRRILSIPEEPQQVLEEVLETRKYCYICPSKLKRKTAYMCIYCKKPICLQCSRKCCVNCCCSNEKN